MMPDERELGRKLRSGDRDAFDAIYQRYADRVMGFALRLCGDRTEAEDLVQEVFLAAYAARGEFRGKSKLLTWLLGIAVRRWRDRQRRGRLDTVPSLDEAAESRASRYAREAGLEDQVVRSITLSRSLRMLDPPFREALLLVASQGLSYREAAEVLGEPVGTVKWRVSEAARRMRRILSTEEECDAMRQGQPRPAHLPCGG